MVNYDRELNLGLDSWTWTRTS